ncbi:unnamed protein product [Allacma fusca]|uniref:Cadherin domain-containing protein n=1 Tax=Allacma fusca TaxID=39272 RepID=A0A8J2LEC4_9HEXA|nr:unnamed protein product [Allacma fusca]
MDCVVLALLLCLLLPFKYGQWICVDEFFMDPNRPTKSLTISTGPPSPSSFPPSQSQSVPTIILSVNSRSQSRMNSPERRNPHHRDNLRDKPGWIVSDSAGFNSNKFHQNYYFSPDAEYLKVSPLCPIPTSTHPWEDFRGAEPCEHDSSSSGRKNPMWSPIMDQVLYSYCDSANFTNPTSTSAANYGVTGKSSCQVQKTTRTWGSWKERLKFFPNCKTIFGSSIELTVVPPKSVSSKAILVKNKACHFLFHALFLVILLSHGGLLVGANSPPQFVLSEGQSEIVLRLKEGPETPLGSLIYRLKGYDPDDDPLSFGLRGQIANELLRIENLGSNEANVYLKKELDREVEDEYMLVVTVTDGNLADGSYVTQSLLILVEDVNDNTPIFASYQATIKVPENSDVPKILTTLEATDRDDGPYGQVVYKIQTEVGDESLFSISTVNGQGVLKLLRPLDYEKKFLHQLRVLAVDRSSDPSRINTATAAVVVQVVDVEDRPPEWVTVPPVTRLNEDVPKGTFVLQVRAVDGDRGVNNEITYSLLNENDSFGVDSQSGIVFTKSTLDRENAHGGSYILQIVASEKSKIRPAPTTTTECTIIINDVNDETPKFRSRSYLAEVVENSPVDVPVTFLGESVPECYDHDLGMNGTFRLLLDGDGGVFEVTPSQGINQVSFLIRVKNPSRLDYERLKVINFTLIAEEISGEKSSTVPVSVLVRDSNDESPQFEQSKYDVELMENSAPGTTVATVKATDKDSGAFGTQGIRYTSLTGSIANELNLDPLTGVITIKAVEKSMLDREISPMYYLTVEARDNQGQGNRASVPLNIFMKDQNDIDPVFVQSRYEARMFENENEFVSPLRVQARDSDLQGTPNSDIRYTIVAGNEDGYFEVDKLTGRIRIIKSIDFEHLPAIRQNPKSNVKRVNFTVRANDLGSPPRLSLVPVTVFVHDVNDNLPIFDKAVYHKIIREDTISGSQLIRVEATDKDASTPFNRVFYRIERGAQEKFLVDAETGIISLAPGALLDYNEKNAHVLEVIAIDGGGKRSVDAAIVNISITDVNNKPPKFLFNEIDGDHSIGIYHTKVPENVPSGQYITQVRAVDPDFKPLLRYGIDFNRSEARNENGRLLKGIDLSKMFELQAIDGVLKVTGNLDRETMETVKIGLRVEDLGAEKGRQIATASLILKIEDVNDNSPVFRSNPYLSSIPENSKLGTPVLMVTADDADVEKTLRYTLRPEKDDIDRTRFPLKIDVETGTIEVAAKIDRERRQWLNFTVIAEDSASSPQKRTGSTHVYVNVIDENDNSPIFIDGITNFTVKENAAVGTIVAKIEAQDKDSGQYGKVTYLLDRKSSGGKFVVDPETGHIRVAEPLDREEVSSYSLVVQAWDNYRFGYAAGESRNAFKQIVVDVADINDEVPVFEPVEPNSCASVTEFHEDIITTVRAKDNDDPDSPNGWVSFKIKKGNELGLFKLEQGKNTAKILPARSLKGFYGNYTLVIEAADGGQPPKMASMDVKICVSDFNDNQPVFINPAQNFTIRVAENATIGTSIIQVRAIDNDIGLNGVVRYRLRQDISGHWETFEINSITGVISLAKLLDREQQKLYHIRIEAHDLGVPTPLSTDLDLTILVRNVDDFKPQFVVENFEANFTENITPSREKLELPATIDRDDEDEEERKSSPVCYFIVPDNHNSTQIFSVDPVNHILSTKVRLDREKRANHTLMIVATEDCLRGEITRQEKTSSYLKVLVNVVDVNDNSPKFIRKVFTGGVTTDTDFGTSFMSIKATDADSPPNAQLKYYIIPPITMSLSEGLSHLVNNENSLFSIDENTGAISLAFDPQPDMKGHFVIHVGVNDTYGLSDRAKALVYLLREDQKVKVTVRMSPNEVRQHVEIFTRVLSNVTGVVVNVDENFKFHENRDGSVDKTKTDFYIHLVHPQENAVLEVNQVLKLIDLNIEDLDELFKEFNVLDTQASSLTLSSPKGQEEKKNLILVYASGAAIFFALILIVVISLCFAQRAKYQRQLKALTANAYGSSSTIIPRTGNVPNTNVHSSEGSNPIWMQAYQNSWYKEDSLRYDNSESRDSLDENAIATESASPPSSHMRSFVGSDAEISRRNDLNRTFHRNLMYNNRIDSNGTCLILKKHLETTEL